MSIILRTLLTILLLVPAVPPVRSASPQRPGIDHVLVVSVDGLRSDALLAMSSGTLPAFEEIQRGAMTLNARTIVHSTVTLPNHVSMVTGRLMRGDGGHQWTANQLTPLAGTVHAAAGATVESMFDVAKRNGVFTAAVVSKLKMQLLPVTWSTIDDFSDVSETHTDKTAQTDAVTRETLRLLKDEHDRSLLFVHYAEPDRSGHTFGWDLTTGSPYLLSIISIDRQLGLIMDAIEASPRLAGRTAIIVTSDHGGGAPHRTHTRSDMWVNYIVPFLVWSGPGSPGGDLYELNPETRRDPGLGQPDESAPRPPVRNADAANLALGLLGLPPIPGSTVGAGQDLRIGGSGAGTGTRDGG